MDDDTSLDNLIEDLFGDPTATPATAPDAPPTLLLAPLPFPPPGGAPFLRLVDAVSHVRSNLEDGVTCPCCGQLAKLYKRTLNSAMARSLIWLVKESGPTLDWVNVPNTAPKWLLKSREMPKLAHWGLIEEMEKGSLDTHKRTSGMWRPTVKGVEFANANTRLPRRVHLYNNQVVGWSAEQGGILKALGKNFDYQELMAR